MKECDLRIVLYVNDCDRVNYDVNTISKAKDHTHLSIETLAAANPPVRIAFVLYVLLSLSLSFVCSCYLAVSLSLIITSFPLLNARSFSIP
jgi:hypothetical protein